MWHNSVDNPTLENMPGAIAGPEIAITSAVLLANKLSRDGAVNAGGVESRPCVPLLTIDEAMASTEDMDVWMKVHEGPTRG